ncbi:MAG: hypothetical protein JW973_16680 [Bacteroidales bacterium]|nr:hypothetical protein [Bacteroidales bacterium]
MNKRPEPIIFLMLLLLLSAAKESAGQAIYQHVSSKEIYSFLDEMAAERIIELNSAVKPYTREFIALQLALIMQQSDKLNKRQLKELQFYLKDYNKERMPDKKFRKRFDIFYYKDSLFTFSLNPILGLQYWYNDNGSNFHRWNGGEVFASVGKHLGVYASLRDNHERDMLSGPDYLTTRAAARYKSGQDFSEMRGGITLAWKWGTFGLVKDHYEWGNFYRYPNVFSSKPPSITHLKLNIKPVRWFEFNYMHGWLASGVVDSLRTYPYTTSYGNSTRTVYRSKYLAANLFTFKPLKNLFFSIGNSIVYSDDNPNPAYLIPVMLYKSIDHSSNQYLSDEGGQNSQFYIDISSRQINHLHLYATLFFDDISTERLFENGHPDYYSFKAGFRMSNLVSNLFLTAEYTQTYPLVYKHTIPTTTFESNFYNMGHYLQDNSRGIYADLIYRPIRGLSLTVWYDFAQVGPDHEELGTNRIDVVNMYLDTVKWQSSTIGFSARYQIINDVFAFCEIEHATITGEIEKYTPPYFRNSPVTLSVGVNYGF